MAHKHILKWLNDAHAMEHALIEVLERRSEQYEDYPSIKAQVDSHLEQTRGHEERLKQRIEDLGGDVSKMKKWGGILSGKMPDMPADSPQERMIKNTLADYAAEHYEIASYRALIAAAQQEGDMETVSMCQDILAEEEEMAAWLISQLPMPVDQSVEKATA